MKNLQISSYDLVGNKFNGYDLHFDLREKGILSKQMVLYKESDDLNTVPFDFTAKDATKQLLMEKDYFTTDIVHLHLIHNILDLNYLPLMTRLKPTIITLHDPFFLSGHCIHHFDCKKWQTHCQDCPFLDAPFAIPADYTSLNFELKKQAIQNSQISAIVASKWMEDKVKESPIWKGKKIYKVPFGVNQKLFKPNNKEAICQELGIEKGSLVLMLRADDGPFKGLDIIKKALKEIQTKKKITLITVDKTGMFEGFKDRYDIKEYGWIKDDIFLAKLYQVCDLFLMPSRQETFGMMAVEAMSCGKMVLAINSLGSALKDIINSPECGLSVDEGKYSEELQRLLNTPEEIMERGEKSLKYAKRIYSKESFIENIIKVYKEVIDAHNLDNESKLILEQLKKYLKNGIPSAPLDTKDSEIPVPRKLNKFWTEDSLSRKLYRKVLPLGVRKKISGGFRVIYINAKNLIPERLRRNLLRK